MGEANSTTRAMSRNDALRAVEEALRYYEDERKDGEIVIDIRGGKPIWVKPRIELDKVRVG